MTASATLPRKPLQAGRLLTVPFRHLAGLTVGLRVALLCSVPLAGLLAIFGLSTLTAKQVGTQIAESQAHWHDALEAKTFREAVAATQLRIGGFLLEPSGATRAALLAARDAAARQVAALAGSADHDGASSGSIRDGMATVSRDVDAIVQGRDAVGYDIRSGLAGAMNDAMDKLDAQIADDIDYSDPLAIAMSQEYRGMRRSQLRFTLSRSAEDRAAFLTGSGAMKKDVAASFLSDDNKAKVSAGIDAVVSSFMAWADTLQRVTGDQQVSAEHAELLSAAADAVVATSTRAAETAQAGLDAIQVRSARLVGATIAGAALLCCGLSVVIGRGISRPIRTLSDAMRRMAGGDLAVTVVARSGRDELAGMSRAVLALKEEAVQARRLEAEAARARAEATAEATRREAEKAAAAHADRTTVDALGRALGALASGDLQARLDLAFEAKSEPLRIDFNNAVETLGGTVAAIGANTAQIRGRSEAIASATVELSRRTEQQAASLEETAASLDQITGTVRSTAEHADHARTTVAAARVNAEASGAVVRRAVVAMAGIETSSQQIGQIIGVIDEIAFQTSLLALNAGVEAARAGEAGRGFAVVASEVRGLAQRSAEAAKEIKALVATSRTQVDQGVGLVGEAGAALERIVGDVTDLSQAVAAIAASATEQALGLAEINTAVGAMDRITQENAAMVEETAATVDALARDAEDLSRLVGQFRTGDARSPRSRGSVTGPRASGPFLALDPAPPVSAHA